MFYDNKIIRFINKNRGMIILVIAIIIFILLIIRVLNNINIMNKQNDKDNDSNLSKEVRKSKDSIITDTVINNDKAEYNYELITNFVEFCNNNDIEQAYNLLTEECKENIYPSIENFNENYIQVIFKEKKQMDIQSWIKNGDRYTYLVKFTEDIISSGNADSKKYQDYITIDEEVQKININRYIGRIKKEKEDEIDNIKIKVNFVDIYKDYEIYSLKVTNLNNNQIILDNLTSTASTYIETNKETRINCSNYEAGINSFKFNPGVIKNIKLKFIKQYSTNIEDKKLVFSSVILDSQNVENTKNITIEL